MAKEKANEDIGRPIDYDPEFHGPLKKRSCTDIICLLLFLAFIVAWTGVGIWAIKNGNPSTLLAPKDSQGLRCGIDDEVKNLKYLFFFDLTKCLDPSTPFLGCSTTQVCVESCPTEAFYYTSLSASGINDVSLATKYCTYDQRQIGYDPTNCPKWFLPSNNLLNRCIYNVADRKRYHWQVASIEGDEVSRLKEYLNPVHLWLSLVTHNSISVFKDDQNVHQFAERVITDITNSWLRILLGVLVALVVCIIYILMLRWIAGIMVWISIAGALAALVAGTYFSAIAWKTWKNQYETDGSSASKTKRNVFLAVFIIVAIITAIILLVVIFLRKRIRLAVALIKEGSKAVSSVTSSLFFPIVPWLLQIGVIAYAVVVGAYLASTGEPYYQLRNLSETCRKESGWSVYTECNRSSFTPSKYESCSGVTCKFAGISNEKIYPYFQTFNVFGFFWLAFFMSALGQMVLAQVFSQWYWTSPKRNLPFFALTSAFYRTIRYHLGTLAFGSLIIAICRIIRLCLEYIDRKLKKYDNQFTKAILCCLKCFFWCLEKFLKFINKNAYIMCAIHGKNFCASAKDAFMLLMRNIVRVFVLDKITDFVFFLSKLLVTAGVGAIAYVFFATEMISIMDNSNLNFGLSPVILIMIITYLIASLFFSVYSMAVDTLFLCFLEDCERNDGKSKPYYGSRNLMKIFGKKNKAQKYD